MATPLVCVGGLLRSCARRVRFFSSSSAAAAAAAGASPSAASPQAAAPAAAAPPPPPVSGAVSGSSPGSLWLWGKVDDNRLGMNLSHLSFSARAFAMGPAVGPTHNALIAGAKQVVCRASKTLVLGQDGRVWSWGSCQNSSLGHGAGVLAVPLPRVIEALEGINIVQIDAGETSSAAVSDEGDVYTWGWGGSFFQGNGGLGHGNRLTQPRPALVETLSDVLRVRISRIAVGDAHMYALSDGGGPGGSAEVFSWGNGDYGRCGNGKSEQLVPEPIELLSGKGVIGIASGSQHGLAVTRAGEVWAWGKNDAGQLGVGGSVLMDLNTMEAFPLKVEDAVGGDDGAEGFANQACSVAAGSNHSLALTRDGRVYQWGQRTFLQPQAVEFGYLPGGAGGRDEEDAAMVEKDKGDGVRVKASLISCGIGVAGYVQEGTGDVFTWGKNLNTGMLGHTIYGAGTRLPTRINALHGKKVASLSFGSKHAAAVIAKEVPARPMAAAALAAAAAKKKAMA